MTQEQLGMKAGCRSLGLGYQVGLARGLPVLLHSLIVRKFHPTHAALLPDGPALRLHAHGQLTQLVEQLPLDEALWQETPIGAEIHGDSQCGLHVEARGH